MKSGWNTVPLQSLCNDFKQDIVDGPFGSELQRKDYITDGFPVLKIQNVRPFEIELKKMDFVSAEKYAELRRHSFRRGDIVMTKLGSPLGVSAVVDDMDNGIIVADLVRIRAQQIDTRYLCYHLNSSATSEYINSMQKGTTRPRVTLSVVRQLPIAVPSPVEQRRIVAILDEAFQGIATAMVNAENNLQNARELYASYAKNIFLLVANQWPEKTIDQISTNLDSKRVPITKSDRKAGEFPYYGASGIVDYVADYIFEGDTLLISEDGANLLARSTPIAFPATGRYWVNNHAHILRFDHMATQRFVEFFLESIPLDEYITGAAQPKLNQKALNSIPIPIPDAVHEQAQVVGHLGNTAEQCELLQGIYERKLAALGELKKSLLHQAFTGALTAKSTDKQVAEVA